MKIYSEINFKWDGEGYKEVSSVSEDYSGPMALCSRGPGFALRRTSTNTYYNESGQKIEIVAYKAKDNLEFKWSHRGHGVYVDGQLVSVSGDGDLRFELDESEALHSGNDRGLDSIKSTIASSHGDNGLLMDESEYKGFIETGKAEKKMKGEIQSAKISGEEALEAQGEMAELEAAKMTGEQTKTLKDTLLATGLTQEEMEAGTALAVEKTGDVSQQIHTATQAGTAQLGANLANLDLDAVKTARDVGANVTKLGKELQLGREQIAGNLAAAKASAKSTGIMDILGGMGGMMAGGWAGSEAGGKALGSLGKTIGGGKLGTAASWLANFISDFNLKENISLVGLSESGVNIYEFDYSDKSYGEGRYRGVMAQEVPWASLKHPDGYLMVDYSKVDVHFERIS
tara:strand:- start:721 stop:1920 length:1200 start_codon:yes stop_codon:yes gene_type:complete